MAKVTGIGGVFFLANDDNGKLSKWYQEHLGISLEEWGGGQFEWKNEQAEDGGTTVWRFWGQRSEKRSNGFTPTSALPLETYSTF